MVTAPQFNFLLSRNLNMKRITTLLLTSLALLTMTSSAMAEEVMDYDKLTPTFEFEIKVGDNSTRMLATQIEYKTSRGMIAHMDVDCVLDKGFFSRTIECAGLPSIDIYVNDLQISNGYGKFKVRVGDLMNFTKLPAGSHPLRMLTRSMSPTSHVYIRNFTIIDGQFVCVATSDDFATCDVACDGIGIAKVTAEHVTNYLYTTPDGAYDVRSLQCRVTCFCRPFSPEDEDFFFIFNDTLSCQ